MYLAIDIGGSKVILAVFSADGKVVLAHKLDTNPKYEGFLANIEKIIKARLKDYDILYCCCAVPGHVDRERGIGLVMGNEDWRNVPIRDDISRLLGGTPVVVENDANLAGLSEALLAQKKYKKVLYITIGTGIGDAVITNGKIDSTLTETDAGHMVLFHEGSLKIWEHFASGRAIVKRYGKRASEIEDPAIWANYARELAQGFDELIAVIQPEVVIVGGGVGTHFHKFGPQLNAELKKLENDMVKMPPVIQAKRPEEAVIYGCYEFIKQQK